MDEKRQIPEEVDRVDLDEVDLESVSGGDPVSLPPDPPPGEWGEE